MRERNIGKLDLSLGDAIYSLRAIRRLKQDPITNDDLHTIIDAARQAPNGSNQQNWHFIIIRDSETRQKLGKLYHEAWWAKRNEEGFFKPEDLPKHFKSPMVLANEIGNAPVVVLVCATNPDFRESVIPATQNLLLAARGLGIGGTITTLHPSVIHRVRNLVNAPENLAFVYCVPLGYPRGRFGPVSRRPIQEVVSLDTWGQPAPWG